MLALEGRGQTLCELYSQFSPKRMKSQTVLKVSAIGRCN